MASPGVVWDVGYIFILLFAAIVIGAVLLLSARRAPSSGTKGEAPTGKPVMVEQPSADEPTPAASSVTQNVDKAQNRTPPA